MGGLDHCLAGVDSYYGCASSQGRTDHRAGTSTDIEQLGATADARRIEQWFDCQA
jgi:hypothetical protein